MHVSRLNARTIVLAIGAYVCVCECVGVVRIGTQKQPSIATSAQCNLICAQLDTLIEPAGQFVLNHATPSSAESKNKVFVCVFLGIMFAPNVLVSLLVLAGAANVCDGALRKNPPKNGICPI